MTSSHQEFRLTNDSDTPVDTLSDLIVNTDELFLGAVALNSATHEHLLKKLFSDEREHI